MTILQIRLCGVSLHLLQISIALGGQGIHFDSSIAIFNKKNLPTYVGVQITDHETTNYLVKRASVCWTKQPVSMKITY